MKTGQPLASFGKAETGHDEDISKKHLGQFKFWGVRGQKNHKKLLLLADDMCCGQMGKEK
jgi:hypothetical protein